MVSLDIAYENYKKMCDKYTGIGCEDCSLENAIKCHTGDFNELGYDCVCCTPDGKEVCKYNKIQDGNDAGCFMNYLKDNYNVILEDKVM